MPELAAFSNSYAEARKKFIEAAHRAGAKLASYQHPAERGPGGEALCLDVSVLGPGNASRVFVVGSGTHGIEGYSGLGGAARLAARPPAAAQGHGGGVFPRAQPLGFRAQDARHRRERRPQPQLHRLLQAAAQEPGLRGPAPGDRDPRLERGGDRRRVRRAGRLPRQGRREGVLGRLQRRAVHPAGRHLLRRHAAAMVERRVPRGGANPPGTRPQGRLHGPAHRHRPLVRAHLPVLPSRRARPRANARAPGGASAPSTCRA